MMDTIKPSKDKALVARDSKAPRRVKVSRGVIRIEEEISEEEE